MLDGVSITLPNRVLGTVSEEVATVTRRFRDRFTETLYVFQNESIRVLEAESPSRPRLPFIWSGNSIKQVKARAWYFANKVPRGSKSGRYVRSGRLQREWKIRSAVNEFGGVMTLENDNPGASFVFGNPQVPSHEASGWIRADERVRVFGNDLEARAERDWYIVTGVA